MFEPQCRYKRGAPAMLEMGQVCAFYLLQEEQVWKGRLQATKRVTMALVCNGYQRLTCTHA